MDVDPLTVAIIAGAAGIVASFATGIKDLILAIFNRLIKRIESGREKQLYSDGIKRIAQFHSCLERLGSMSYVDRVLVFTGTNCGGVPDPKKPYVVKCFYGWSSKKDNEPERFYDFPLKVDSYYVNTILQLLEDGVTTETTAEMSAASQLRHYYEAEGVYQSRLYQLHISSTELIYLSVANYTQAFQDKECREIDILVDRMRSVLQAN